jgi:hypothetical protein
MKTNIAVDVKGVERAMLLEVTFKLGGQMKVEKNNLTGELTSYDIKLRLISSSIQIDSIPFFEQFLHFLLKIAVPELNMLLTKGIKIPYIEPFFSFHKSELKVIDRFIKISINPAPILDQVIEESNTVLNLLLSYISN